MAPINNAVDQFQATTPLPKTANKAVDSYSTTSKPSSNKSAKPSKSVPWRL